MIKPGRPRVDDDDRKIHISVRITAREYEAICAEATRRRESIGETIRRRTREFNEKLDRSGK